ncbi:MAG: Eco57I restriction-modification methylase domain-containing protein [Thermoguttaceae bacterium]
MPARTDLWEPRRSNPRGHPVQNHQLCKYIITSNFQKLRLYIDKATCKIEFDLFSLTEDEFQILYLCLSWNSIQSDLPQKILAESITQETDITKKLYEDYSAFKKALFDDICSKNPQHDKLVLFKKTQKLLDRFLFLFFAEDRGLLTANSVRAIIKNWQDAKKWDKKLTLYQRFREYFGFLNEGNPELNVFPYNGGLFVPDDVLDAISIDDTILAKHTQKLADYDFASEVDVNILGHIFEHSLTEIEEITAELSGVTQTPQKSKRKKDGIFYTPKYITSYIVEQTLGKLCEAKRMELGIDTIAEELPAKKAVQKKALHAKLESYRNWLLSLKICDPACGSGAFLNQTLEFLIEQHKTIDELHVSIDHGKKTAGLFFVDVETAILENNLYGVDINDESVEIAKLSLWPRSAAKGRKLNDLSHRIKLGNSLIDDPKIAGDKAFDWEKEFPEVFSGTAGILPAQNAPCGQDARVPTNATGTAGILPAQRERCRQDACGPTERSGQDARGLSG